MADLPSDRVTPNRAFNIVGVDYCGPFLTRNQNPRSAAQYKSYIAVFVCFCTKAIHLEVVSDLTSQSFLAALRRFVARRGKPSVVYSDNGTNFVGANNILKEINTFIQTKASDIIKACAAEGIDWKFIPAGSPHHGGLWEAGVKSFKYHLKRVSTEHPMNFEELTTMAIEIECCLNSRPLTPLSDDPNDLAPLTPSHFLNMTNSISITEPDLSEVKIGRLKRWRQIQAMIQSFWKRWSTEYLNTLQNRSKWTKSRPDICVGELVLVCDENLPPGSWLLGRVVETHPGKDGKTRVASIKIKTGVIRRSITKLCPLPIETHVNDTISAGTYLMLKNMIFQRAPEC